MRTLLGVQRGLGTRMGQCLPRSKAQLRRCCMCSAGSHSAGSRPRCLGTRTRRRPNVTRSNSAWPAISPADGAEPRDQTVGCTGWSSARAPGIFGGVDHGYATSLLAWRIL